MTKSELIIATLRQRLALGDYDLRHFPSERDLAAEFGVSYMTARKAVLQLVLEGLLAREGRGRAIPARRGEAGRPILALLAFGWPSRPFQRIHEILAAAAQRHGLAFRDQHFVHWDDPAVATTLSRSQGVLVLPPAADLPETALERIAQAQARTAIVGTDLSAHGIHGIDHLPAEGVRLALDHLAAQGHRRIAVLNIQPHDHAIRARLAEIAVWARARQALEVVDVAIPSGADPLAAGCAAAAPLLGRHDPPDAILGLTLPAAQGILRAAADQGRRVAVVAIDGEGYAEHLVPSITTVDGTGLDAAVADAVAWMAGGIWEGPLFRRCGCELRQRETTRH